MRGIYFKLIVISLVLSGGQCFFILPSMLMATTGGILMGKMTMAGLLMMLMAANQQQQGQNFLRNLGIVPPSSSATKPGTPNSVQDLIVRKKRSSANSTAKFNQEFNFHERHSIVDEKTQYRIMRQVAGSDSMGCLPNVLCSMSAEPPNTQSGLLNDYTYLLKSIFSRDDDDISKELDALASDSKKKKHEKKEHKKKDGPENDDENESSEEDEVEDDGIERERRKDLIGMNDAANEKLLVENPEYIPFALRDSLKVSPYIEGAIKPKDSPKPADLMFPGFRNEELTKLSDTELDELMDRINGKGGKKKPSSFLSKLFPKLTLGFSSKSNNKFEDDPFFSGFKRSISGRGLEGDIRPPTPEEEQMFKELRESKKARMAYIAQKKKELAEIKDPVEKFRIAAEVGSKLRSTRQCRFLFNTNCPFSYNQVLGMISDFRKAIMGEPINNNHNAQSQTTPPAKDTIVILRTTPSPLSSNNKPKSSLQRNITSSTIGAVPTTTAGSVISFNSGSRTETGVTSIIHQLPTGEKVEISLKLRNTEKPVGKGSVVPVNIPSIQINAPSIASSEKQVSIKLPQHTTADLSNSPPKKLKFKKASSSSKPTPASSEELLFDGDQETGDPEVSVESLKAAMMAIQKIHQMKSSGKPISFSQILSDLAAKKNATDVNSTTETVAADEIILPEPDQLKLVKLQKQNLKQRPNNPKLTASLLASSIEKVKAGEDDEVDDAIPLTLLQIKQDDPNGDKTNKHLVQILEKLKLVNAQKQTREKVTRPEQEDSDKVQNDDRSAEEEAEEDMMDTNETYTFPDDAIHKFSKKRGENTKMSPITRHEELRRRNIRKPKKLFLGYDRNTPRDIPL